MPYLLGIDIGTSSTLAATVRPEGRGRSDRGVPQLLGLGSRGAAVPSVLFLGDGGEVLIGEAAERRTVSHPERVVREVKRRVGDTVPVSIGDLTVTPEDLLATQARWVVDRATEREGEAPAAVALAVPATWGSYRTGLVHEALAGVGLADVTLVSEPRAAARHYLSQGRVPDGAVVAVYDFGGGTFDAAVLRKTGPGTCEVLGEPEGLERLGGADLDDLVLAHVAAAVGDRLSDLDPAVPGALAALARLRRECTEAKEALSADAETTIPVLLPDLQTQVRLVRAELEELIGPAVEETVAALAAALDSAKVAPDELEAILLVGGSSRIPLVAQLLSARFDRPIAVDTDPQASVAFGAALAAADAAAPDTPVTPTGIPGGAAVAATPDEAPARLAAVGSAFNPVRVPERRRHITAARAAAVAAAVVGITVVTSVAGGGPAMIEAGRSTLSGVVAKLGDSVQPEPPAAAAAEEQAAPPAAAPMASDARVFAGRRVEGHATSSVRPSGDDSPSSSRSGTTAEPGGATGGKTDGTPSPGPRPGTVPANPGTPTPTQNPTTPTPSPTTPSPSPTTPSPSPTTPSPEPTTPSPEPTTPAPDPTTPPTTQEPTTPPPTTPPPTEEPTPSPSPTTASAEPTTDPPATQGPAPGPSATTASAEVTTDPPSATPSVTSGPTASVAATDAPPPPTPAGG